jgi:DNA-binding NtrC family response regulator
LQLTVPQALAIVGIIALAPIEGDAPNSFDCPAAQRLTRVDGRLDDWPIEQTRFIVLRRSDPKLAEKDLSAEVAFRFDDDAMYLAFTLQDEQIIADTSNFWDGDGIDLYFDVPMAAGGATTTGAARHRLTLLPFNQGRRFGVITWANRRVLGPGGLQGVDVVAQEVAESSGSYRIEARVPLRPLGIVPSLDRDLGFEIAVRDRDARERSDADSDPPERADLSLSGRADLSLAAGPLPRLHFVGEPRADASGIGAASSTRGWWGVAGALLVLALLWAVGKSARRIHRTLHPRFPRWRTIGLLAIAAAAVLLAGGVDALDRINTWRVESALKRRGATLRDALAELSTTEVAARLRGADDTALGDLLAGRSLQIAETNRFEQIDVTPRTERGPGEYLSLEPIPGVPFREYGVRVGGARGAVGSIPSLDVVLERPERARRVHVALAAFLPSGLSNTGQVVGGVSVQVQFANRPAASAQPRFFTIDDAREEPVGHNFSTMWGKARLKAAPRDDPWLASEAAGMEIRHVDHFVMELEPGGASAEPGKEPLVSRITVAPTAAAGTTTLWISGITFERGGATPEFAPLALGSPDRNGFPMAMRDGRPAPRELSIAVKPGKEPTRTLLFGREGDAPLDLLRLRVYYRAIGPVLRALAEPATLNVRATMLVTLEGRDDPLAFPLRAGLEIDDAELYERQHPASMTSFLASTFETRQGLLPLHYDGYELPLGGGATPVRVKRIEVEQPPESRGSFVVAGITALVRDQPPPLPKLQFLSFEGTSLSFAPAVMELLRDSDLALGYAVAREGVLTQSGGALPPEVAERMRGTGVSAGAANPGDLTVRTEQRVGRTFLSLPLDCTFGSGNLRVLLLAEPPSLQSLRARRDLVALVAALLALPFVLLLLVDGLARIARVRTRLSFLFLLTSLAPLSVLFVVLAQVLGGEQRRAEERRADELLTQVRERAARLGELATEHAVRALKDLEDSNVFSAPGGTIAEDQIQHRLAQLAQSFPDRDANVAIVAETIGQGGVARRIHSNRALVGADPRFDAASEGLALSWGQLVFSGSAASGGRALKVRVAGALDAQALKSVRLLSGEGESIALLAPPLRRGGEEFAGGEPLARSALGRGVDPSAARGAARELDAGRGVFFQPLQGGGTCGFDLLRARSGEPVAIVSAGIGARPVRVDLGFASIELSWFVLALGAVILAASQFLGSLVTDGITRPLARLLRGAVDHAAAAGLSRDPGGTAREDAEDEVSSLETSFRRLTDELARRGRQQSMLIDLAATMGRPGELQERAWRALEGLHQVVGGNALACYVFEPAEDAFVLAAHRAEGSAAEFPPRLEAAGPELKELLAERRPRTLTEPLDAAAPLRADAKALVVLPMLRASRPLGVVLVRRATTDDPLAALDPAYLAGVLGQIASGLESARLETRTIEDPETGLFVHAHFVARVCEEVDRAAHTERPLALLVARLRSTGAETESRELRRKVASVFTRELRRVCRDRELVARAAAVEFEVLAPYGGRMRAEEIVRELRVRLADPQSLGPEAAARIETSIAEFPGDARSADFLFSVLRRRLDAAAEKAPENASEEAVERFRKRFPEFGFGSPRMQPMLRQLEKAAVSDATVLVLGETGSGKEVAAQLLHRLSPRAHAPFVAVHCAALPEKLLESELFGYEKGAFTGADQRRLGRFEQAHGSTLFLDEVAEIPVAVQVKLLRVLQERKVQRLGAGEEIPVDVRVVAATHQSLERRVAEGTFREDLYYRLKVVTLELPPLRERIDEIPMLVDRFLSARRASDPTCRVRGIEPAALDLLARHNWPGNVRELRNVIERAVVLGDGEVVRREDIEFTALLSADRGASVGAVPMATGASTVSPTPPAESRPSSQQIADAAASVGLTERQRQILALVRNRGALTSREYCAEANVSQRTALRDLAELVDRGHLVRHGSRRGAIYRLRSAAEESVGA